jgi:aminobenzoyl-glutamate transport protein
MNHSATDSASSASSRGILGWIERTGNKLPDPVFIFVWLIAALIALSLVASLAGLSVVHPTEKGPGGASVVVSAASLLSPKNVQKLWTDMPQTFAHFHPLGMVLVVMLGAGVAERSGFFSAGMRALVRRAPKALLTPVIAFAGILGNLAADAAYVVLIPMAGVLYAAAGRHPILGIVAAFAGVSGGFSANLLPGQLDALLFGITEAAAETINPKWDANIAGNWYFIIGMTVFFLPAIWWVTDKVMEPRLGKYTPPGDIAATAATTESEFTPEQRRGLRAAGIAAAVVVAVWLFMVFGPGTPLFDEEAKPEARLSPLYKSLVGGFFVLFLACGWAYGSAAGTVRGHRDVVKMMSEGMGELSYYLVLAFAAAHFVAMFNWSNLGLIFAVNGAHGLKALALPAPILMALFVVMSAFIDLIVGSASAKWAFMAPVLVPMFMLIGVSPEMTTAAYRVGDSVANIITPLMVYFPLVLTFCQRWNKDFGIGSLTAAMTPYATLLMIAGLLQTILWVWLEIPLGPGASVHYPIPAAMR